jgi:hypothetical protein
MVLINDTTCPQIAIRNKMPTRSTMADETVNAFTDTDLPDLCPACLDRRERFDRDDTINDKGFKVGHMHGDKCSRCVCRGGAEG